MYINPEKHNKMISYSMGDLPTQPKDLDRLEADLGPMRHYLQQSDPEYANKLKRLFAYIEYVLYEDPQISGQTKLAVKTCLIDSVRRCTDGLLVELEGLVPWLKQCHSLDAYLQQVREGLVMEVARAMFTDPVTKELDVHNVSKVFKIAADKNYGVLPRNPGDKFISFNGEEIVRIRQSLTSAFEQKYKPIPILCSLMEILESTVISICPSNTKWDASSVAGVSNLLKNILQPDNLNEEAVWLLNDDCVPIGINWLNIQARLWHYLVQNRYFILTEAETIFYRDLLAGNTPIKIDLDALLAGNFNGLFKYHPIDVKREYLSSQVQSIGFKFSQVHIDASSPEFLRLVSQMNACLSLERTPGGLGLLSEIMSKALSKAFITNLCNWGCVLLRNVGNHQRAAFITLLHLFSGLVEEGGIYIIFDAMDENTLVKVKVVESLAILDENICEAILKHRGQDGKIHLLAEAVFLDKVSCDALFKPFKRLSLPQRQQIITDCLEFIRTNPQIGLELSVQQKLVGLLKLMLLDMTQQQYLNFLKKIENDYDSIKPYLLEAISIFNPCRQVELYIVTLRVLVYVFNGVVCKHNQETVAAYIEGMMEMVKQFANPGDQLNFLGAVIDEERNLIMLAQSFGFEFVKKLIDFIAILQLPQHKLIDLFMTDNPAYPNLLLWALENKDKDFVFALTSLIRRLSAKDKRTLYSMTTLEGYNAVFQSARFYPHYLDFLLPKLKENNCSDLLTSAVEGRSFLQLLLKYHPNEFESVILQLTDLFPSQFLEKLVKEDCQVLIVRHLRRTFDCSKTMSFIQSLDLWTQYKILWAKGGYFHNRLMHRDENQGPTDHKIDDLFPEAWQQFTELFNQKYPYTDSELTQDALQRMYTGLYPEDNGLTFFVKRLTDQPSSEPAASDSRIATIVELLKTDGTGEPRNDRVLDGGMQG